MGEARKKGSDEAEGRPRRGVVVAAIAMWMAGIGGMVLAGYAADGNQFVGAGFCLLVSVLAFGQLLNAHVRK